MADVKGDLTGISQAGSCPTRWPRSLEGARPAAAGARRLPGDAVGRVRRAGPPGARHRLRHGPAAAGAHARPQRDAGRRAEPGVQDRRRQRPRAARPEGPARDAAVRRRQRASSSPPSTATSARPASARSSAACCRSRSRAATSSSASRCSTSPTSCRPTTARASINILAADKLMNSPRLYATFLLWMLSELFETLPEVGDLDKPKLVFFFDEAHLLFNDAPKALVERIELVVRLVRSKGVGVYFVTQNPLDMPDTVLGQLGNRVQHALRAFTPRDQKAVKAAASTMRANPKARHRDRDHRARRRRGAGQLPRREGPARASPSACSCCRRAARSARSRPSSAQALIARLAGGRRLREDGRPRIGLREAQGPRRGQRRRRRRARRTRPPATKTGGKAGGARARPRRRRHARRPDGRPVRQHRAARRQARRPGRMRPPRSAVRIDRLVGRPRDRARRAGRHPRRQPQTLTHEHSALDPGGVGPAGAAGVAGRPLRGVAWPRASRPGRARRPLQAPVGHAQQRDQPGRPVPDHPMRDYARIAPLPASGGAPASIARCAQWSSARRARRWSSSATTTSTRSSKRRLLRFVDDVEFWYDPAAQAIAGALGLTHRAQGFRRQPRARRSDPRHSCCIDRRATTACARSQRTV